MNYGILSIIPILVCFSLIFISKNAFISIISGIVTAIWLILFCEGNFILFKSIVDVFSSTSTLKTVIFILIVGALIKAIELSKGVEGLLGFLEKKKISIESPILVQLFTMLIGICLFVDATSSMAITSVVGKPLFHKAKLSDEKLALITNSTASPIAWIVPFGGAGALMTSLITPIEGISNNAFSYVLQAVPFQLYTLVLLFVLVISIIFKIELGDIKYTKYQESPTLNYIHASSAKAQYMVIPIICLLVSIFTYLTLSGNGNIFKGDGSSAVFYGGLLTLVFTSIYYKIIGKITFRETITWYIKGINSMATVTLLLAIALVFSDLITKIGTAMYLLGIFNVIQIDFLPLITLCLSAILAFSTGTSGGTVAIVTGLVLPMAVTSGVSVPLILGAIVSGSVFGDQNSIISDSVILTSSVTGVNAITHVKTQLPYTVIALSISALLYGILGFII